MVGGGDVLCNTTECEKVGVLVLVALTTMSPYWRLIQSALSIKIASKTAEPRKANLPLKSGSQTIPPSSILWNIPGFEVGICSQP